MKFKTKKEFCETVKRYADCWCFQFEQTDKGCSLSKKTTYDYKYMESCSNMNTLHLISVKLAAQWGIIADPPQLNKTWEEGVIMNIDYSKNSHLIMSRV